jgi:CO dehydrogenase/acetyl-CoA synthase beta subunit
MMAFSVPEYINYNTRNKDDLTTPQLARTGDASKPGTARALFPRASDSEKEEEEEEEEEEEDEKEEGMEEGCVLETQTLTRTIAAVTPTITATGIVVVISNKRWRDWRRK